MSRKSKTTESLEIMTFQRILFFSPVSGHFPYSRDFVVSPLFRHFWKRLEVKKVVRLQGWKVRRLEGWKVGRSEGWNVRRLEG